MTLEEFDEYAKAHDYVIFTRQQYEHVTDVMKKYEQLQLEYKERLRKDTEAILIALEFELAEIDKELLPWEIVLGVIQAQIDGMNKGVLETTEEQMDLIKAYGEFTRCFGYTYTYDEFVTKVEETKESLKRLIESKNEPQESEVDEGI